jgi:hypothetical protein
VTNKYYCTFHVEKSRYFSTSFFTSLFLPYYDEKKESPTAAKTNKTKPAEITAACLHFHQPAVTTRNGMKAANLYAGLLAMVHSFENDVGTNRGYFQGV